MPFQLHIRHVAWFLFLWLLLNLYMEKKYLQSRLVQLWLDAFWIHTKISPTCRFPVGFKLLVGLVRWSLKEKISLVIMEEVIDPFLLQVIHAGCLASTAYQYSIMEKIVAVLRLGVTCCWNESKETPPMNVMLFNLWNIKKPKQASYANFTIVH